MLLLRYALLLLLLSFVYVKAIDDEEFVPINEHEPEKSTNASQPDDQPKNVISTVGPLEKSSDPEKNPSSTETAEPTTTTDPQPSPSTETVSSSNVPSTSTEKSSSAEPASSLQPSSSPSSSSTEDASSTPAPSTSTTPAPTTEEEAEPEAPEPSAKDDSSSGTVALTMAIMFAITVIIVYFGLLAWRRYLEWRYGNRELLVNDLEFDTNDLRHFEL